MYVIHQQPSLLLQDLLRLTPSPLTLFSANSKAHSAKSKLIYIFRATLSLAAPSREGCCLRVRVRIEKKSAAMV
jgi:hypothetical protein